MTELVTDSLGTLERLRGLPSQTLLDLLDDINEADAANDRPAHTKTGYAADWALWTQFCGALGVEPLTARSGLLRSYVKWLEDDAYAPATIKRRLAGVIAGLRDGGLIVPEKGGPAASAWQAVRAYEARLRKHRVEIGRGKALPFQAPLIKQACGRLPADLFGLRDKAIVLIGYSIAARESEVAALHGSDITMDPQGRGMEVYVRYTKGGKERTVPVPYAADAAVCPVRTWMAWQDAAGITDGPAICQLRGRVDVTADPGQGITPQLVTVRLRGIGQLLDTPLHLTGHSLRAGRATDLDEAGHDAHEICAITGHSPKSGTVYDYMRRQQRWNNPAVALAL